MIDTRAIAKEIRIRALEMVHRAHASHIASSLSAADLLSVLYGGGILNFSPVDPMWPERDRFILSKGHAVAAYYAVLAEVGFFDRSWLDTYCRNESCLAGHASSTVPGIEVSTGSLGHGLPIGTGMALAGKRDQSRYRVFVLLSDGEMQEGSNWEAILFAAQHRLDNLVAIVDYNRFQAFGKVCEIVNLEPFTDKWKAFGWAVTVINGHDHGQIRKVLQRVPFEEGRPSAIIAHTIKGKGISFMEDRLEWHYRSPDERELRQAVKEVQSWYESGLC